MLEAAARTRSSNGAPIVIGRYALFDELAAGGMATVHLGRLLGPVGFGRTVAVKRLHSHFLKDEEFITMFMDEARIVARIAHPNVVPMVDVVQNDEGLFLVMEYVHGESLSRLMRTARKAGEQIPPRIASAIMGAVLFGLHAAHDTKGADGELLGVVHRDVSPQNIIVGADGDARVLDFGIAKAAGRVQVTREGQIKGKLSYMAPEQIRGNVDRRSDVFAASVLLWEMLAGRRFHDGAKDVDIVTRVMRGEFVPPSTFEKSLPPEVDAIVMRGLAVDPRDRHATAREMALELQLQLGTASPSEVSAWVERLARDVLVARGNLVSAMELAANDLVPVDSRPPASLEMSLAASAALPVVVHVDEVAPPPGEAPSSSSVFVHAHSAKQTIPQAPRAQSRLVTALVVLLSILLAASGIALGTFAIYNRSSMRAPLAAAIATPAVTEADPTPVPTTTASAAPPLPSAAASSSAPLSSGESKRAPLRVPGVGSPRPSVRPAVQPTAAPAAKPNCDPAYIVDDVGHRHYKPECD